MKTFPKRTNLSQLTDDELLILDFLAIEGNCNTRILKKANYPVHMNSTYTHNISDEEIDNKMIELASKGLLTTKSCSLPMTGDLYSITEEGGRLWEIERTPVWGRYCIDSSYSDEYNQDIQYLEINSVGKDIGLEFAACLQNCGLYSFELDELETIPPDLYFVPWKNFKHVFAWKTRLKETNNISADWEYYENHRTWWRGIHELQKFLA